MQWLQDFYWAGIRKITKAFVFVLFFPFILTYRFVKKRSAESKSSRTR